MDQETPHSNKKVIFIALGAMGVISLILFLTFLSLKKTSKENVPNKSFSSVSGKIPSDKSKASENIFASVTPTPLSNWKNYQTSKFSIIYPPDWKTQGYKYASGSSVLVSPLSTSANTRSASLSVIVESASTTPSLIKRQESFSNIGFKKDNASLGGLGASRLRGVFPPKSQETHIFLDKGGFSYLLVYKYIGTVVNPELENTFAKMISSFKFAQ